MLTKRRSPEAVPRGGVRVKATRAAPVDGNKRLFLKLLGITGLGFIGSMLLPKRAEALVFGSTPASNVVGVKNAANARINPATQETVQAIVDGQSRAVLKYTGSFSATGAVLTPGSGLKLRIYCTRFSLDTNLTSVSFRFGSGGTDHEKYVAPRAGGLYGAKNHPNYVEGGTDVPLYVVISGTGTVQVNVDYLQV